MNTMKIGFLGAGNMATAIIKGICNSGYQLSAFDIDTQKLEQLSEFGVGGCASCDALVSNCDFLVLAIKPQSFETVLPSIKDVIKKDTVIISIAAGISAEYIKQAVGYDAKVVLVMPNTPLLLGMGATALAKVNPTTQGEFESVMALFAKSGVACEISAEKMKEIIPINGSSPAFVYLFAKGFIDYAEKAGIDQAVATQLFCATLKGSAEMIEKSGSSIDELIKMVSSPGGTTLQGLAVLEQHSLLGTIQETCNQTVKRAYELVK